MYVVLRDVLCYTCDLPQQQYFTCLAVDICHDRGIPVMLTFQSFASVEYLLVLYPRAMVLKVRNLAARALISTRFPFTRESLESWES